MYSVAIHRQFVAQHFLIGGDWGRENEWHSHRYRVEVRLEGPELDRHGFLVDIVDLDDRLDRLVERFRDTTLNDDPAFAGLNPSVEHFARILCTDLDVDAANVSAVTVTVWEDERAYAAFRRERGSRREAR
jgi:6-pyruvoyltetrahydropterin/6-carboxytetrahydropterin synthase